MISDSLGTKIFRLVSTQQSENSHSAKSSQVGAEEKIVMQKNSRRIVDGEESDEGYTLRTQEEDNLSEEDVYGCNVNANGNMNKINGNMNKNIQSNNQYSESGIMLYSQEDDQFSDYQEPSGITINSSSQSINNQNIGFYQQHQPLIDFTPQSFQNLCISQHLPSTSGSDNVLTSTDKLRQQDNFYNDTISYLEDVLGNTYLDGLVGKSIVGTQIKTQLPPKIQCTAAYLEKEIHSKDKFSVIKPKQPFLKVNPNEIKPQSTKSLKTQQLKKESYKPVSPAVINRPRIQQKIDNNQGKSINNVQITNRTDDKFKQIIKKQDPIIQNKQQKQDQSAQGNKISSKSNSHESSLEMPLKKRKKQTGKNADDKQKNELLINNFLNGGNIISTTDKPKQPNQRRFLEDEGMTRNYGKKDHQKKYYVQKNKQKVHKEVNGWLYLERGNVMYDDKVRPWVMETQLTQQERYYQDLMKRQFITSYQKEALESYLHRVNSTRFTPPPYIPPFSFTDPTIPPYYNTPYQHNPYHQHHQQNLYNAQLNGINNVQHTLSSSNNVSTKTMVKKQYDNGGVYGEEVAQIQIQQQQQQQKQAKRQNLVHVNKPQYPTLKNYDNILPSNILQSSKSSPPVALIKQMSKPDSKSQVFVLYDVPVIVSNESISSLTADIFLLPYCKAMLIDKVPSRWIKCLEKMTGINILQKLDEMNQREIKQNGREIAEGTLNKIRISQRSGVKLNFNTLYLAKLTTLVDQGSRNPFGQRLLRSVMDKVIQSLVNGILNRSSTGKTQRSLLIHGGFFPGVKRQDTPRLISSYLSLALANSSLEYKRTGIKPNKIYINVTKEEEYEVYVKEMRKIQLQYRKLQNF